MNVMVETYFLRVGQLDFQSVISLGLKAFDIFDILARASNNIIVQNDTCCSYLFKATKTNRLSSFDIGL